MDKEFYFIRTLVISGFGGMELKIEMNLPRDDSPLT